MWTCARCNRVFVKSNQPHSCKSVPLESHFQNKEQARELFDCLVENVESKIGKCKIISLPCCIHLFGNYDFLAALPRRDRLEIRFVMDRELRSPRLKTSVPMSRFVFKNCIDIYKKEEIDFEIMGWLGESNTLKY